MTPKMANLRKTGGRDLLLKRLGIENSILLVDYFDRHHCAARFVTALFYYSKGAPVQGTHQPHQPTGPHATRAADDAAANSNIAPQLCASQLWQGGKAARQHLRR